MPSPVSRGGRWGVSPAPCPDLDERMSSRRAAAAIARDAAAWGVSLPDVCIELCLEEPRIQSLLEPKAASLPLSSFLLNALLLPVPAVLVCRGLRTGGRSKVLGILKMRSFSSLTRNPKPDKTRTGAFLLYKISFSGYIRDPAIPAPPWPGEDL